MEKVIVNLDNCESKEEAQKMLQEAMLAMFAPALEGYQEDGDVAKLCQTLGCKTPARPTFETPLVLEQLKAAFGPNGK